MAPRRRARHARRRARRSGASSAASPCGSTPTSRASTLADGRVSGVTLADGEHPPRRHRRRQRRRAARVRRPARRPAGRAGRPRPAEDVPSLSGFVLLLAVRGRTPGLRHHNVWFPADYDGEFDAIFGRRPHPVHDPAIYVCAPDDPRMRPDDDSESWFVLVNAPRHGDGRDGTVDWDAPGLAEAYADHVLAPAGAAGWTCATASPGARRARPPTSSARRGPPAGPSTGRRATARGRPSSARRTSRPSRACSSWAAPPIPGGGLPLVGMGAEIVADLIRAADPASAQRSSSQRARRPRCDDVADPLLGRRPGLLRRDDQHLVAGPDPRVHVGRDRGLARGRRATTTAPVGQADLDDERADEARARAAPRCRAPAPACRRAARSPARARRPRRT